MGDKLIVGFEDVRVFDLDDASSFPVWVVDAAEDAADHDVDGLDCGPDDLRVVHLSFGGDAGLLERLNDRIAYFFDLPTRLVTAEHGNSSEKLGGEHLKPADPADEVLNPVVVRHFVIPREDWLRRKADYAKLLSERERRSA